MSDNIDIKELQKAAAKLDNDQIKELEELLDLQRDKNTAASRIETARHVIDDTASILGQNADKLVELREGREIVLDYERAVKNLRTYNDRAREVLDNLETCLAQERSGTW